MEYSENSAIPLNSIDVRLPILTCSDCDRVWRADQPERCVYCAREYGELSQTVDAARRRALFEAIQAIPLGAQLLAFNIPQFREQSPLFAAALAEHCPWYDAADPLCVQACWFALSEECPWAHIAPNASRAQAIWDDFHGPQPLPVEMSQLIFAALFFELDFQDCAHLVLDEDPQEKWAAYLEDRVELHGI
jgi:hypothetical protein